MESHSAPCCISIVPDLPDIHGQWSVDNGEKLLSWGDLNWFLSVNHGFLFFKNHSELDLQPAVHNEQFGQFGQVPAMNMFLDRNPRSYTVHSSQTPECEHAVLAPKQLRLTMYSWFCHWGKSKLTQAQDTTRAIAALDPLRSKAKENANVSAQCDHGLRVLYLVGGTGSILLLPCVRPDRNSTSAVWGRYQF